MTIDLTARADRFAPLRHAVSDRIGYAHRRRATFAPMHDRALRACGPSRAGIARPRCRP